MHETRCNRAALHIYEGGSGAGTRQREIRFLPWLDAFAHSAGQLVFGADWLAAIAFGDFLCPIVWFVGSVGFIRIQCGIKIKDSDKRINILGVLCLRQYLGLALKPFQIQF